MKSQGSFHLRGDFFSKGDPFFLWRQPAEAFRIKIVGGRIQEWGQIDAVEMANLDQMACFANDGLRSFHTDFSQDPAKVLTHSGKEVLELPDRKFKVPGDKSFQAMFIGLFFCFDLGGYAHMAGIHLAFPANRTANGHHGECPESDPVGAKTHDFQDICGGLETPIGPYFNLVPEAGIKKGPMNFRDSNFHRQSHIAKSVHPGGAGSAIEPADGDDIRSGFGDTDADGADSRDDRHLDCNPDLRIGAFQFGDKLGKVFDGVKVVVIGGRDEIDPHRGFSGICHFGGNLLSRKMPSFSRLGSLSDLDFHKVGRIQKGDIDAEAAGCDLLSPTLGVFSDQLENFSALSIETDDVHLLGSLRVGPVGDLSLGAEGHGADDEGVGLVEDGDIDAVGGDGGSMGNEVKQVADGNGVLRLDRRQLFLIFDIGFV